MVPLKLQIKNFVSYGPKTQVVDFERYNLICLSGKNGHGKSALLDAITWALWGHARRVIGTYKSDEALLHMGQTTMMVSLDFISKDKHYRVRREYNLCSSGKSYSNLEFGFIDKDLGIFKSLTDKNIRLTQEKIEKAIGLDYNSFINSAFFRQNHANEFSKKSPKDRKEILASILGLNRFECIKKLASERVKEVTCKRDYYSQICIQLEQDTANKNITKAHLQNIIKDIELLISEETNYRDKLQSVKKEQESISGIKAKLQQIIFEKEQLISLIKNKTNLILEEYLKWRSILRQSKKVQNFNTLDKDYNDAIKELNSLQVSMQKKIKIQEDLFLKNMLLKEHILKINSDFNQNLEAKKFKLQQCKSNLENLSTRLSELKTSHVKDIDSLEALNNKLSKLNNNYPDNFEGIFDKRKATYSKFQAKLSWIENEIKDIHQKRCLIEQETQAACPLCQQDLHKDYKDNLNAKLKSQENFLNYRLNKLININSKLKELIVKQSVELETIKKNTDEINIIKLKIDNLLDNISKIKLEILKYQKLILEENTSLESLKSEFELLQIEGQNRIQEDKDYKSLKAEISKLESELNIVLLDLNQYSKESALILKIQELQETKKEQNNILTELTLQKKRQQNIAQLCKDTKELKVKLKQKELECLELQFIFEKEMFFQAQEKTIHQKIDEILSKKEKAILEKGAVQEQYRILKQKEADYLEQKKALTSLTSEINDYKVIATSLSKDGIQALLIENAIPEIENEANVLLSLMTDNQSHIIIDSLKDLKSGGTKETLDIKISDSLGLRPYELFSGGESFKIDFALRIAISKLLARRSGVCLQTLIIDEGFGSQDEEGLSNIMNIIYKIQDSFSKIIVVSHLTSMKDQFPVNFLVHKTPQGTLIKIVEQA